MNNQEQKIKKLREEAIDLTRKNFPKVINFYHTGNNFPAISITGSNCALSCKHCEKKLLERLPGATTPKELYNLCTQLNKEKKRGVLLTGGCTKQAKVPIKKFLETIKKIKAETGMLFAAHVGLVNEKEAKEIRDAGIDCVCIDVVGSPETAKEIYGVEITNKQYIETLSALKKAKFKNISPHVCVGLHYGSLRHEIKALEIIYSTIKPTNIVITGLTEVVGTPMEGIKINPLEYAYIVCLARLMFPTTSLSLGCARGKGEIRAEIDTLCAGIANNIAIPTKAAYDEAKKQKLEIKEYDACCSFLPEELK